MNDSLPNSDQPNQPDWQASVAALRQQLNIVLLLLFLVSATLAVFFMRQSSETRKQRDMFRQIVAGYQQKTEPAMKDFTAKLREYGKTHPDVMPILIKYGVVQMTNPAAAPAAPATR